MPGDVVRLRMGDVVPADARLIAGEYLSIDQAALTGESLPVSKKTDDSAYSGSIVKKGEMVAVVTGTGSNTFFGRTAKLVQTAGAASHFQKAVMRIGDFLIIDRARPGSDPRAVQLSRGESIFRVAEFVLILLVASVPVAMPAVLSVTMAMGAKLLARQQSHRFPAGSHRGDGRHGDPLLRQDRHAHAKQADSRRDPALGRRRPSGRAAGRMRWPRPRPTRTRSTWRSSAD